jgi:hypothetical protein
MLATSASARQDARTLQPRASPLQVKGNRAGLRLARLPSMSMGMNSPFRLQLNNNMLPQNTLRRRARNKAYKRSGGGGGGGRKVTLNIDDLPAPTPWEGTQSILQRSRGHSTTRGRLVPLLPHATPSSQGQLLERMQSVQHTQLRQARTQRARGKGKGKRAVERLKAMRPISAKAATRHVSQVERSPGTAPTFLYATRNLPRPRGMTRLGRTQTNPNSYGSSKVSTLGRSATGTRHSRPLSGRASDAVKQTASNSLRKGEAVVGAVRRTASEGLTRSIKLGSEAATHARSVDLLSRTLPRSFQRTRGYVNGGNTSVPMKSLGKETLQTTLEAFLVMNDPALYGASSERSLEDVHKHAAYLCETYEFPDLAKAVRTKYHALPRTWEMELVRRGESDIDVLL